MNRPAPRLEQRPRGRLWLACLVALELLVAALPASAEDTVRLGIHVARLREWTREDVRGTFDLWAQELAARFQIPVTIHHYDDPVEMRRDFVAGRINGVNTDAMTLVRNFKLDELAEGYASHMKGGWGLKLFAGRGTAVRDLGDLSGKRIVLLEKDSGSDLYLETLCLRHHGRHCKDVFSEMRRVATSNQALMRLFFGQADLALVQSYGHELAVELNPQLAGSLRLLAEQPFVSQFFAFYSAKVDKEFRQRTLRVIPTMHTYPRGRQLLDLFKVERLDLAVPADLLPFVDMESDYRELKARIERKKGRRQ